MGIVVKIALDIRVFLGIQTDMQGYLRIEDLLLLRGQRVRIGDVFLILKNVEGSTSSISSGVLYPLATEASCARPCPAS